MSRSLADLVWQVAILLFVPCPQDTEQDPHNPVTQIGLSLCCVIRRNIEGPSLGRLLVMRLERMGETPGQEATKQGRR